MTTNDIYEAAKARGLARSLRHFSQEFLGPGAARARS